MKALKLAKMDEKIEHKVRINDLPKEERPRERLVDFLVENKAYPMCSKKGKIFFIGEKSDFFEEIKDEIIEKLHLKSEKDCKRIRETIKNKLAKQRTNKPIRKWIKEERPREMLVKQGAEKLTPAKLLAILLRTGRDGVSAEELARMLLNHFGSLRAIDSASIQDLQEIDGIGMAKAAQIKASLEIGKRLMKERAEKKRRISSVKDTISYVRDYYSPYLRDSNKEFFNVILLDVKNKVIDSIELSKGSLTGAAVDEMEIIKESTKKSASSIILVHSHPSGEVEPSEDDIKTTKGIMEACKLVGIRVLDHVIIGKNEGDFFSFLGNGIIGGKNAARTL
jgi:DNA repair protein RadC